MVADRLSYRQTSLARSDHVVDMLLSTDVERVQKQSKLLLRLATQHRQQLLVRSEGRLLGNDVVSFHCTDHLLGVKLSDKSRDLDVQCLQQEHVVLSYNARM